MPSPARHVTYGSAAAATPIGVAEIVASPAGVVAVGLGEPGGFRERLARDFGVLTEQDDALSERAGARFDAYFSGERHGIDLDIDWSLVHGFARDALQAVCEIPYGETASYGEVAAMAGRPRAARAVGTACRTSPFSLVVPVHRVVRADGSLGEYGGRTDIKRFLVDLERQADAHDDRRRT